MPAKNQRAWRNMEANNKPYMQEYTWSQIRDDVLKVNPELTKVIDDLSPSDSYTLFKAKYPYGSEVLNRANFCVPNKHGKIVPLSDNTIDQRTKELLNYNLDSNPVSLLLKNKMELFIVQQDHTISASGLISPGNIFGTYRILSSDKKSHQPAFIWSITAGARSVFMLPKISEAEKHNNLRKHLDISSDTPKALIDHWDVFKNIANSPNISEPWSMEVIFFSSKWFEHLEDKYWQPFHYFLLKSAWQGGDFWRNNFFWNLIFTIIQKEKSLRPSPYIADTVKYLFAIGVGALPGFKVATDNSAAPIADIQKAYIETYKLKKYLPIIMHPGMFDMDSTSKESIYYSLHFPNAVELGQNTRTRISLVQDLYETRWLLNKYITEIASGRFNIAQTPLCEITKKVKYDYFHDKVGTYPNIRFSKELFTEDENFKRTLFACNNDEFPINSPFVKGCIKISQAS